MGSKQNYIEINGRRYDAVTGKLLDAVKSQTVQATPVKQQSAKPAHHVKVKDSQAIPVVQPIDGFKRSPKKSLRQSYASSVKSPQLKLQKSKTLMRAAVAKPSHSLKPSAAHHSSTENSTALKATITPRTATPPPHRQQLAQTTPQSSLIHKFSTSSSPTGNTRVEPISVQPMPVAAAHQSTIKHNRPSTKTSDLLEQALQAAKNHNEPYYQHRLSLKNRVIKRLGVSGRTTAIGTAVLAGLLLGGFYAYQNVPNLAMRVAATRAGFKAGMPSYAPAGFGFSGPVQYSAGQVVVSFSSRTDDRNYRVTQQATNWSSDSLLNNYVLASGKQYQTYQERGRTVYIYDGSSATWVDSGVWYQIDGKSDLTSDQLVRIAASL